MSVPFKCSDCGGDGTRCDCHKRRPPAPYRYQKTTEERIRENDVIIKAGLARLRRMRRGEE